MTVGHNRPPMPAGWIAIHRTIRNHHIVGYGKPVKPCDPSRGAYSRNEAWTDLLMECRYADGTVLNGGRSMELRRGELVGAISWLAARWNWTPKTVRGFIDALEADGAISVRAPGAIKGQQKGKQAHVISVCNYDKYQSQPDDEGQAKGHALGTQKASNGQATGNILIRDNKDKQYLGVDQAPPALHEQPKPGEEALAHGVFVNCQTVRHKTFSISIEAIAMQLATASGLGLTVEEARAHAKQSAVAHALQWALEIENGRHSDVVVPKQIANFIRGSVASQLTKSTYTPRKAQGGSSGESPDERKKRLFARAQEEMRGRK